MQTNHLKATLTFCDKTLLGADLAEVAHNYRPLMALPKGVFSSCFFDRIGSGSGPLELGVAYEVQLRLPMRAMIEEYLDLPTEAIWPPGGRLRLLVVPDRTVAEGTILGLEILPSA